MQGLSGQATATDVRNAYQMLFGRPLEDEGTLRLLNGHSRSTLLKTLLSDEEFNRVIVPGLCTGHGLEDRQFDLPVAKDIASWAPDFFGFEYKAVDLTRPALTGSELLTACLTCSSLWETYDALNPPGTAEALAAAASAFARSPGKALRPGIDATSRDDLVNCYRFFLGREPETDDVVRPRSDTPVAEAAIAFILSEEFNSVVLIPGLEQRFRLGRKLGAQARGATKRLGCRNVWSFRPPKLHQEQMRLPRYCVNRGSLNAFTDVMRSGRAVPWRRLLPAQT